MTIKTFQSKRITVFDISSKSNNPFSQLTPDLSADKNQHLNAPLDPFAPLRNSNLALSSYTQLSELAISPATDTSLIKSLQAASHLVTEQLTKVVLNPKYDEITGLAAGDNSNQKVVNTPADYAGNSISLARDLGILTGSSSFSDWVGSADTNDYYRFSVGTQSNFSLGLTGLTADADVQLLNSSGTVISSSILGGTSNESITTQLSTGTYYVRVFPYSGDTNYNLSLNATPLDAAGNTLATARNDIGTLSGSRSFSDWVGSTDTNDYYRFSIATQSNFNLTLNGLTANADVQLIQDINNNGIVDSGDVLQSSTKTGTTADTISRTLNAGTYFARVYPISGGNTNYNLSLNVDSAGNTLSTARNDIGTLSGSRSFSDWVGTSDTNDYYRFSIGTQSNFSLNLTGLTANADVQLLNSAGTVITTSALSGTSNESITTQLNTGTYYVRVYPASGANTNYNLSLNATSTSSDWYDQNLRDAGLISLTRSLATDGKLSRNDMISIFRDAEDGSVIDANELTDLRTIVSNSSRFGMDDFVKVLSNKIANSDPANTTSGVGNLYAGSSTTQMENLIGKWFLGNARPATSYSYQSVSGSLFQNGISANDINQNALGDCYYLATLSSIAQEKPSYIQNMFTDNGDNTFTVRFYNNGVADYVTVDRYLPTSGGREIYAGWGGASSTSSTNELWVALAEKAYAQLAESGWSRPGNSTNSYSSIEGGWMDAVIRQVTALSTTSQSATNMTQTQLINLVNSSQILTAGFVDGGGFGVVNSHAYTITSYNSSNGTFHLRNPWGTSDADVTFAQLQSLTGRIVWSNT